MRKGVMYSMFCERNDRNEIIGLIVRNVQTEYDVWKII